MYKEIIKQPRPLETVKSSLEQKFFAIQVCLRQSGGNIPTVSFHSCKKFLLEN